MRNPDYALSPRHTLISLYLQGRLPLEKFVSERIGLNDIEDAFHKMHTAEVLRSVVVL